MNCFHLKRRIKIFALLMVLSFLIFNQTSHSQDYDVYPDIQYKYVEGIDPNSLSFDIYTNSEADNYPVILYAHGGGWIYGGDKIGVGHKPSGLLSLGYIFISTNFRTSSSNEFPVHCQDIASAVTWIYKNISDYGGDPEQIYIMGHSSGAHLVPLVSNDERYLKENGLTLNVIKGVIPNDQTLYDVSLLAALWGGFLPGQLGDSLSRDPESWQFSSPLTYVKPGSNIPPHIVPYSNLNAPVFAENYVNILNYKGFRSIIHPAFDKNHGSIDGDIGLPDDHVTTAIVDFIESISPYERLIYKRDYQPGSYDELNNFMGGTETSFLKSHNGMLFAGIGYRNDKTRGDPLPGPQVLVKKSKESPWQVDFSNCPGTASYVSCLESITFTTDKDGESLEKPVTILLAAFQDNDPEIKIYSRDDITGMWKEMIISSNNTNTNNAFVTLINDHVDNVNGIHYVFAADKTSALYRGTFDPELPGRISWYPEPELICSEPMDSSANANGILYIAAGSNGNPDDADGGLLIRIDGDEPEWQPVYEWDLVEGKYPGMRGLTSVSDPDGGNHEVLLGVREASGAIVRIDPMRDHEVTGTFSYKDYFESIWEDFSDDDIIAGYDSMLPVIDPDTGKKYNLISLKINHPERLDPLYNGSYFLIRNENGSYAWENIYCENNDEGLSLQACRSIAVSPFPEDDNRALYFGGFDSSSGRWHNTAWIYRGEFPDNECDPATFAIVDLHSNGDIFGLNDHLEVKVKARNFSDFNRVDLYAAMVIDGVYRWYPDWDDAPRATEVEPRVILDNTIVSININQEIRDLEKDITFHAVVTENGTFDILDIDSITIKIK